MVLICLCVIFMPVLKHTLDREEVFAANQTSVEEVRTNLLVLPKSSKAQSSHQLQEFSDSKAVLEVIRLLTCVRTDKLNMMFQLIPGSEGLLTSHTSGNSFRWIRIVKCAKKSWGMSMSHRLMPSQLGQGGVCPITQVALKISHLCLCPACLSPLMFQDRADDLDEMVMVR